MRLILGSAFLSSGGVLAANNKPAAIAPSWELPGWTNSVRGLARARRRVRNRECERHRRPRRRLLRQLGLQRAADRGRRRLSRQRAPRPGGAAGVAAARRSPLALDARRSLLLL